MGDHSVFVEGDHICLVSVHEAPGIVKIGSKCDDFASGKNWWAATATA